MTYLFVKWVHVMSATVLFGTGVGTAFYLLVAATGRDVHLLAGVSRWVVRADWLFTATTAVLQPLTGLWLVHTAGIPLSTPWVRWSLILYGVAMACWLPVVFLQMKLRDLASAAQQAGAWPGPPFRRVFLTWVLLGIPALIAFLAIFWLMVAKPV